MGRIAVIVTLVAWPSALAAAQAPALVHDPPAIVTEGDATIKRAPDRAWISVSAEQRESKPGEAQRKVAETMTAVRTALAAIGVSGDAIRTIAYSITPEFEYPSRKIKDYIARNQVEVRVDNLEKVGEAIDASAASGASSVTGLRFDVKDRAGLERDVLKAATEEAMARARTMASASGQTTGAILRLQDSRVPIVDTKMTFGQASVVGGVGGARGGGGMAASPVTPIDAGEIEVAVHVTLTIAIR